MTASRNRWLGHGADEWSRAPATVCSPRSMARAAGVDAALTLVRDATALGLTLRAGLHTGEIVLNGTDVSGVAVHLASRIESAAAPGAVMVSSTVVD